MNTHDTHVGLPLPCTSVLHIFFCFVQKKLQCFSVGVVIVANHHESMMDTGEGAFCGGGVDGPRPGTKASVSVRRAG
jgi:hypothetical protein